MNYLSHIVMSVKNIDQTVLFYISLFDFEHGSNCEKESPEFDAESSYRVEWITDPGGRKIKLVENQHITGEEIKAYHLTSGEMYLRISVPDIGALCRKVNEYGGTLISAKEREAIVSDPNGFLIRLNSR